MTPRRLRSENFSLTILQGHHLDVTLAYDLNGRLHELAFVTRSKIGGGLDQMLVELGIKLSRAMQGRDPDSGGSSE